MHDQPRRVRVERAMSTAEQDAREERRVLREVLDYYPGSFTLEELICELTAAPPEGCTKDTVKVAVIELMSRGLLHRLGDLVLPTRPAVVFHSLTEEGEI